jgi:hypothetical protein
MRADGNNVQARLLILPFSKVSGAVLPTGEPIRMDGLSDQLEAPTTFADGNFSPRAVVLTVCLHLRSTEDVAAAFFVARAPLHSEASVLSSGAQSIRTAWRCLALSAFFVVLRTSATWM